MFPKKILYLLFFLVSTSAYSQIVFYTETFDGAVCVAGSGCDPSLVSWTVTSTGAEGANANRFYVSCRENGNAAGTCGSGCGTNQTLHVGNVSTSSAAAFFCPSGDCGAAYDASGAGEVTSKRCESPTVSCVGYSGISVNFDYIERGQTTNDDATIWYFDGATWALLNNMTKTSTLCAPQGRWTNVSINLPASANNNANVKIAFRWVNNGDGTGSDPSFAVNDVRLRYNILLPVKFSYFDAELDEKGDVNIFWKTATETNNDYFTVEKSMDGEFFTPFSIVNGSGNSSQETEYHTVDYEPFSNITYYRLRQTDFNGEMSFSNIIALKNSNEFDVNLLLFPNPAENSFTLISMKEISSAAIMDLNGKNIEMFTFNGNSSAVIDVSELPNGIYLIVVDLNGIFERKKLIVSR